MAIQNAALLLALWAWFPVWRTGTLVARLLLAQLMLATLTEGLALLTSFLGMHNVWLYNLYLPLEFVLLLAFTVAQLPRKARWPVAGVGGTAYVLLYAADMRADLLSMPLASQSFLFACLLLAAVHTYLLVRLADRATVPLLRLPDFWLSLSVLLYFGVIVPYIGLFNYLQKHDEDPGGRLYIIVEVLFVLRYGSIAWAGREHRRNAALA